MPKRQYSTFTRKTQQTKEITGLIKIEEKENVCCSGRGMIGMRIIQG
jgi:hypothetical protein